MIKAVVPHIQAPLPQWAINDSTGSPYRQILEAVLAAHGGTPP